MQLQSLEASSADELSFLRCIIWSIFPYAFQLFPFNVWYCSSLSAANMVKSHLHSQWVAILILWVAQGVCSDSFSPAGAHIEGGSGFGSEGVISIIQEKLKHSTRKQKLNNFFIPVPRPDQRVILQVRDSCDLSPNFTAQALLQRKLRIRYRGDRYLVSWLQMLPADGLRKAL